MKNIIGKNRPSPKNEDEYIAAYIKQNPTAKKNDNMDISAVTSKDGTRGHGLLSEKMNRGHDKDYHIIKSFIPDSELRKNF